MSYSRGVLIHNFNEDQYGEALAQTVCNRPNQPYVSVAHQVHNWKDPAPKDADMGPPGNGGVERHLFFGHCGDMRDPHTNMQKTEFATANSYFFQDPAHPNVKGGVGSLSADGFTVTMDPVEKVRQRDSHIAGNIKQGWGDKRQSHALPASSRFETENNRAFQGYAPSAGQQDRLPRAYHEFTRMGDAVSLTSQRGRSTGLASTGRLAVASGGGEYQRS